MVSGLIKCKNLGMTLDNIILYKIFRNINSAFNEELQLTLNYSYPDT